VVLIDAMSRLPNSEPHPLGKRRHDEIRNGRFVKRIIPWQSTHPPLKAAWLPAVAADYGLSGAASS
jgi:hypothetical protein